jgi:DNA-binding SARP family transcriptional activator
LLAIRAGRVVSTEELIDALWGDDPPASARKAGLGV